MSTESAATPAQQIATVTPSKARHSNWARSSSTARPTRRAQIRIPLATINRHGLVAGATGTGKTKTLQVIAEQLGAAGVPVVIAE